MNKFSLLKLIIELFIICFGIIIGKLVLIPIEQSVLYTNKYLIIGLVALLTLTIYWILQFNRSILLKSIYVKSVLFIGLIFICLILTTHLLEFIDTVDSFDLSLFGTQKKDLSAMKEKRLLNYLYTSHLFIFSSTIISFIVLEYKLFRSILKFIARMK